MKYGKLFNAYMSKFPNANKPSANRCSLLTYKELRDMAKNLYTLGGDIKDTLSGYMRFNSNVMSSRVYMALTMIK